MNFIWKRVAGLVLSLSILVSLCVPSMAVSDSDLRSAVDQSAAYMLDAVRDPQIGSIGGEWAVLGLARSGCDVPQAYWDGYYAAVEQEIASRGGVLHEKKYTEYSRVVLALTAIGANPTDVAGYNLLAPLGDFEKTVWQGINGPVWALIALDSGGYEMPVNAGAKIQATRQLYVDEILSRQLTDGGWNLTGKGAADVDITSMALQALARYQDQAAVKTAAERALTRLSSIQDTDGGYSSWGTANAESTAQVIVALCELGIDLNDPRFVKNGHSLVDNLMSYRGTDGSFLHTADGSGSNQMAAEQGFYALVAALRASEGRNSLYRMDDAAVRMTDSAVSSNGLPGKHADVKCPVVSVPGASFSDTDGHPNQAALEALAARGIIAGFDDGTFAPHATMTRAQFAAVVVRGLGLPLQTSGNFTDIKPVDWCASFVGTAYTYGIVNGRTASTFDPNGTITRQEAAVMVARAAKLCGMDTKMEENEIFHTLAQFPDCMTVGQWARESVAFCYSENIFDQSDLDAEPTRAILRCEVAQMVYNLLDRAKLL